jgi:tetratricopeptide (TPR) repeat protein
MPPMISTASRTARFTWQACCCALGLTVLGQAGAGAWGSSGHDRVGTRVIQRLPHLKLRVGKQLINPLRIEIYRVVEDQGRDLMLAVDARGLKGLVESNEVVPLDQSLDYCARYIAKIPDDPWGYYLRAIIWHREKNDLEKAFRDFNLAINRTSESPRFRKTRAAMFCGRGAVWASKQEFDRAIADFSVAIALDPSQSVARQDRANALMFKEEVDKAIEDLDEAIRICPDDPVAFFDRGRAWYKMKDHDKALDDLSQAIALRPYYAQAFVARGRTFTAKTAYDQALADFNTAIRLDPDHPWGFSARAWLLATCPDPKHRAGKTAVKSACKACELSGWTDPEPLDSLAASYAETGEFDSAVKSQEKAIELSRDEAKNKVYRDRLERYRAKEPYRESES